MEAQISASKHDRNVCKSEYIKNLMKVPDHRKGQIFSSKVSGSGSELAADSNGEAPEIKLSSGF